MRITITVDYEDSQPYTVSLSRNKASDPLYVWRPDYYEDLKRMKTILNLVFGRKHTVYISYSKMVIETEVLKKETNGQNDKI